MCFKINLYLSTSDIATTSEDAIATITNQVATANGYTQDTEVINAPTWVEASGTVTFDVSGADPAWTASGGSITARFAGIYDDTVASPRPNHHHAEGYRRRLQEYEDALEVLELYAKAEAIESKRDGDVTIEVPSGRVGVAGQ